MLSIRFIALAGSTLFSLLFNIAVNAQHVPSTFYAVRNDGVSSDRFQDPETPGRLAIDRYNAAHGSATTYYSFDHIQETVSQGRTWWRIYYFLHKPSGTSGPWAYGSGVNKFFVCDPTPKIGPNYGSDVQGDPKVYTLDPTAYPNGCSAPTVDSDKNPCASNCAGNPINVGLSNKVQIEVDYLAAGSSRSLRFERRYNSNAYSDEAMFPFHTLGMRWRHNFDRTIALYTTSSRSTAAAFRPDGSILKFTSTSGTWTPDADIADKLVRLTDGGGAPIGWAYTTTGSDVEFYDVTGRLNSITFRDGRTLTLTYSTPSTPSSIAPVPGLLINVVDVFGRALQFSYDSSKRIQHVTDPAGGVFTYAYDLKNNLVSVVNPDASVRTYVYAETAHTQNVLRINHLTGIIDENAARYATFSFDSYGRATGSTHANGADATSISYTTSAGNVTSAVVTDGLGMSRTRQHLFRKGIVKIASVVEGAASTAQAYDTNGNLTRSADLNGNSTCFAYDTLRNLQTFRVEGFPSSVTTCPSNLATYTPASGTRERKIGTIWHSNFRLPTSITEANRTTSFTHDASGNVLTRSVTDTSAFPNTFRIWTYTYNSYGQVLSEDGPRTDASDVTTYTYYTCATGFQCGQLNTITNALGHVTTYNAYNAHGQPTQITDANGLVTTLAYDTRQRLTDRCIGNTLPVCTGGELTHLDYWPTGLLKRVTNPDASYIEYTYDNAHRLTQINDGALNKIAYTLDNTGNRTAENTYDPSNALRRTHTRVYNTLNQLWKDVNAAGTANVTTVFGYDTNGNQTTTSAPLSRNSTNIYDELNRLKQITDPGLGNTLFGYDANDNLTSVTDPRSLVTSYTYTGFGDLKTQTSPDTGLTTNTYDSGGNLDTSTDSRAAITDYAYDVANRVTSASFTKSGVTDQTITYAYDAGANQKGRLTGASDANHSLAWSYDAQGRITGKGQTVGAVTLSIGYGYNASGQLSSTVLPSGSTITYGYNTNGQVASLTLNGSTTLLNAITYDPFGPITSWAWGNGTAANRAFDTDGKIMQVDNASGASLKNYAYDDAFRITGITDAGNSALSWTYGYDLLDRLNSASKTGTAQGWTYDANGNRLTETGTTPSTYANSGTSNRVSSITGSLPRTYAYDTAGNTLSYAGATFTYNNRGRMATATNGGVTATYTYNALGQRIKRTASGVTTLFVYDEAGHLGGEYTSAGALIQETVWLGDIPAATLRPNGSGGVIVYYVHADHLNTPRLVTDAGNNVRWRWDSDPFGAPQPNDNPSSLGAFLYSLRFPGQQFDSVVGLHYNDYRDYDPATGKYTESDPIGLGGGANTFTYVGGNPISNFDPWGLDYLEYTGRNIHYYPGQRGVGRKQKPLFSCPATSGTLQKVSAAGGKLGPVPQGHYRIDLTRDPNRVAAYGDATLYSAAGIQRIPTGEPDRPHGDMRYLWGDWRMRLEIVDAETTRDNFYIHNSHKGQTSGCIETCDELLDRVLDYARRSGSIDAFVEYTTPYTRGDTSRPYRRQ